MNWKLVGFLGIVGGLATSILAQVPTIVPPVIPGAKAAAVERIIEFA
jgi:hypothetical protein